MPDGVARVTYVAPPDRNGGSGLSLRTLAIASAASLTAAMVTSRIFPPGTIYASALTPVIVAAVSEMLSRPADAMTELRRQRRVLVLEAREMERARMHGGESTPLAGAPEFALGAEADEILGGNGNGTGDQAPIRIHGRRTRRLLHPKVWIVTGIVAFLIAIAVLTLPELIFGGAVATKHRTTFFGGGTPAQTHTTTTPTTTQSTGTTTATQTTPTQTTTTETTTTPTSTQTGTQTTPTETSPTPTDTGTSTTPAPSGAVPPTP